MLVVVTFVAVAEVLGKAAPVATKVLKGVLT